MMYFRMGREKLATMTDEDIFEVWNEHLDVRDALMKEYDHVAVEIPIGRPQVEYMADAGILVGTPRARSPLRRPGLQRRRR